MIAHITEAELFHLIELRVQNSTQKEVAMELRISSQYLGDILHGRRKISNQVAAQLGYERRSVFVPLK